jgi:hypothetical protein
MHALIKVKVAQRAAPATALQHCVLLHASMQDAACIWHPAKPSAKSQFTTVQRSCPIYTRAF